MFKTFRPHKQKSQRKNHSKGNLIYVFFPGCFLFIGDCALIGMYFEVNFDSLSGFKNDNFE